LPLALFAALVVADERAGAETGQKPLVLTPIESEPKSRQAPDIETLRSDVSAHPDDRTKRVALVRGLIMAKDLDEALAEAKRWRAKDAYNLVAVRALGDVHMERGEKPEAERVYSAIVELLPRDTDAQRSLATLLKQRGDLPGAEGRLRAAVESRPEDARILFELADVEQRLGKTEPAAERLDKVIGAKDTPEQIRYPAKLRLAQILADQRRKTKGKGDTGTDAALTTRIDALGLKGGLENDVHIYLTWDTDRTDVDLWVTTPSGEKVFYGHKEGKSGEALFDDVTNGYGPESFTAKAAASGDYLVQVNYFGGRRGAFPEARGEVIVVLDEGRPSERKHVLPYRLFAEKDTVTVARITAGGK
jgi:tetratricopeptide (TPR) repeat protein